MARALAISSAAALVSVVAGQSSDYAAQFTAYYKKPSCVPTTDKCCVDCNQLCTAGLSKGIMTPPSDCGNACGYPSWMVNSQKYCLEACVAHSIETTRPPASTWAAAVQQGKYVQKVMAEYCGRGVCKGQGGLAQNAVEIHKHAQGEGEAWKVPALSSGWPKSCASSSYYCDQLSANMYHETSKQLGPHPGADSNQKTNRATYTKNCNANWGQVKTYFDGHCACVKSKGQPSLPPGFLQEEPAETAEPEQLSAPTEAADEAGEGTRRVEEENLGEEAKAWHDDAGHLDANVEAAQSQGGDAEQVDVGSFIQVPAEL